MPVTIYDVAQKAGVGIGTVSRVINGSAHLSDATRQKVLIAIDELHYTPHHYAQGLARNRTNMVAVIIPHFCTYFFVDLIKGIQNELASSQYNLMLYSVNHPDQVGDYLAKLAETRTVDGIILSSLRISDKYVDLFREQNFSVILVDSHHPHIDSVTVENRHGAYRAVSYLVELGHQEIGMIDGQLASPPAKLRYEGFRQALEDHGLVFHEKNLIISDVITCNHGFSKESGYHAMKRMLNRGADLPTALFVSSDIQAVGALQALNEAGLQAPRDISIIGFDDIELSEYLGLTTMRQPITEMGRTAARQLLGRINGDKTDRVYYKAFETRLIERLTCEKRG